MIRILFFLLLAFSSHTLALDYQDYDKFERDRRYKRSEIVTHSNRIWVSVLPNSNVEPSDSRWIWSQITLTGIKKWQPGKLYLLGDSVVIEQKFYFIKRLGFSKPESHFGQYQWEEFTHPAIGYELPILYQDNTSNTIDGVDSNFDGVRDDYEIFVVMKHTDPVLRMLGFKAGKIYQLLLNLASVDISEVSFESAALLTDYLVAMRVCVRQKIHSQNNFFGYQHKYINTTERFEAYYRAHNMLYELLGDEYEPKVSEMPCQQVTSVEGEKG
ncbi:hypothetical protein FM038_017105 [Shewanella eurypsychrophilus]|uniref:Uncharacterized protein n=1 Tax=Shewanella eurypsychrophilus TaxID=2593656 RepID=A0ABX6VAN1_9GAMM|nr:MULTISPECIES: hypothetical protein [Shewanella]QFU23719.1 hypothetical protein FS418_18895 [Shewanella sp. YLB-09]QPG58939.1 hypothetical protein FM038_017105 [Shewanella eurypsychrophilus]